MQGYILLAILFVIALILGIDALKYRAKEMKYLRENHPERFDKHGRFIPYQTGTLCRPNLPINAPEFPSHHK